MSRSQTKQQRANGSVASSTKKTHLSGFWLVIARIVWLGVVIPSLGLFVVGLPVYYRQLQRPCGDLLTCNIAGALTAKGLQALATLGISASGYATFLTLFWVIIVAIWSGIGLLIFWRGSDDGMALLTAFFLVIFNITYPGLSATVLSMAYPILTLPVVLMGCLAQISQTLFLLLFPSGRLLPRWTGLIIPLVIVQAISLAVPITSLLSANIWPGWLNGLIVLIICGTIIVSQVYRYRRVSTPVQRQQTKWVAFAITTVATGFLVFGLLFTLLFPVVTQPDSPYSLIQFVYPLLLLSLPVSVGIATLRYRLWDIDIIIKRTLVYGLLTAFVIGMYVLVVGYLGTVFHTDGNLVISLIATGIVAVLFQPLRDLLQRGINRLLYGLRDEPYVVLAGLGQRLKTTLDPDAVLTTIVATVREALKLSYVAIEVKEGTTLMLAASSGSSSAKEVLRLPLVHQGQSVGRLLIAPRGRDDTLTPADLRLLDDLTHQIGVAVHTVRLTSDLRALTRDLQRSREHLVSAREEERRRLRRDLHDGLGPMLSAILLKVGLVRTLYRRDPETTETLPHLPAAVEVAAYRIVQEAVTNVLRHAHAQSCCVRFQVKGDLQIEVSDDGKGLEEDERAGVGLTSMRERAEELGGTVTIRKTAPRGMQVTAFLPLPDVVGIDAGV